MERWTGFEPAISFRMPAWKAGVVPDSTTTAFAEHYTRNEDFCKRTFFKGRKIIGLQSLVAML